MIFFSKSQIWMNWIDKYFGDTKKLFNRPIYSKKAEGPYRKFSYDQSQKPKKIC